MDDIAYWVALNEYPKFGPRTLAKLFDRFDSMKRAFNAPVKELMLAGVSEKVAQGFVHLREEINPHVLMRWTEKNNIGVITINDEQYPPLLKTIYDPPPVLFFRGIMPNVNIAHLAIVGSRKASPYGIETAKQLSTELADAGLVIVSGMAYGIDQAAHSATVSVGGTTVAVLGCGLLQLNSTQRYMADKIVDAGGAVVSEFPLRMQGLKHNFPFRNRVISGMSHGTLVIEATEKSGSLITARTALEQNRDVFAVPGPINSPTSHGTNNLLKMGAHVATQASDVLDLMNIEHVQETAKPLPNPDSKEEAAILELLTKTPIHIDEITRTTGLESTVIASTLSLMEMKGRTRQIGGMYYILV